MLSHRDRVKTALAHQKPDRVPVDLGGTQTSILVEPYAALKKYLGLDTPTAVNNIVLGLAKVEDAVLNRFDVDFRHILPRMPSTWKFEILPDDSFFDDWGVRWQRPTNGYYYDMVEHPLAEKTLDDLDACPLPDPLDRGRIEGVAEEAHLLHTNSDYALEAGLVGLWESAWFLVGLQKWLYLLKANPEFIEAVLNKVENILTRMHGAYLDQVGKYLDLVTLWDDYGAQTSTLISPQSWRKHVKPRLANLIAMIKTKTNAAVGLHSCGCLIPILDDLVEVGVEVLNPIQVSAKDMHPEFLKQRYGNHLAFWGGIDTFSLLPHASAQVVRQETKKMIDLFGENGGYILAAVHNIQPGVPPQNIVAMYDAAYS